ncbi:MAG TPA: 2-succinyl-5-enolpyruvyl-6-hydroxy-3-cyclohexene-1-carboxylic-acid synthase [Kiritimatiellia bacterium]|nr:2-succinyl-5-enolpyruvyl-6-hydroxy-3-cyclohexene-1-carboxylic-acid synthase [Kiritimatiellia bacterium]
MSAGLPPPNRNGLWARLAVEELLRLGAGPFIIAPGSRSSPLALAAFDLASSSIVHWDERGCGFLASGWARSSGKPPVVITTSGTAVANLFPAVVEASMEHLPLILLTADRPPELRETGANQTIDQARIFGTYVRWFCDLGPPDIATPPSQVLSVVDHAMWMATGRTPGPVHVNIAFREPLAPVPVEDGTAEAWENLSAWRSQTGPLVRHAPSRFAPSEREARSLAARLSAEERGVIVAGGGLSLAARSALLKAAVALNWPILPDVTSGLRLVDHPWVIHYADAMGCGGFFDDHLPRAILHAGGRMTSKRITAFLNRSGAPLHVLVGRHGHRIDPERGIHECIDADPEWIENLLGIWEEQGPCPDTPERMGAWTRSWSRANRQAGDILDENLGPGAVLSEPGVARIVSSEIPHDHVLFLGSSMPVRDMDLAGVPGSSAWTAANRGASGIDGTVASAIGFANGAGAKLTLVLGDLALLHDLNSLALAGRLPQGGVIVVVNNNGGGIFHFLPVAEPTERFETLFGTPHGRTFRSAADLFSLPYHLATDPDSFRSAYRSAAAGRAWTLIEVQTNREANLQLHRDLTTALARCGSSASDAPAFPS